MTTSTNFFKSENELKEIMIDCLIGLTNRRINERFIDSKKITSLLKSVEILMSLDEELFDFYNNCQSIIAT